MEMVFREDVFGHVGLLPNLTKKGRREFHNPVPGLGDK